MPKFLPDDALSSKVLFPPGLVTVPEPVKLPFTVTVPLPYELYVPFTVKSPIKLNAPPPFLMLDTLATVVVPVTFNMGLLVVALAVTPFVPFPTVRLPPTVMVWAAAVPKV